MGKVGVFYDNVGSYGSGYYSDDGNYEVLGSDSGYQIYGSVGFYESVEGYGTFLGDSAQYFQMGPMVQGGMQTRRMAAAVGVLIIQAQVAKLSFTGVVIMAMVTTPRLQEVVG